MIMKSDMQISLTGDIFTDEVHSNIGAVAISLRDTEEDSGHDYFRSLVINTLAGGAGVTLIEDTDYVLSEENTNLSTRASTALGSTVHIYKKVQIINVLYQVGSLFFSGYYHGDVVAAERLNKEKIRLYEIDSNTIINSSYGCGRILCDAGANGIRLTLDFEKGQEIEFRKVDDYATNKSAVTLIMADQVDNFTAIGGNYYIFLFEKDQHIKIYYDGTYYHITGGWIDLSTGSSIGGINTNDWTNRHLGDEVVVYNNETVAFQIGEKVTEATSNNTGIIVWLDATTMILKKTTGTGIHVNARALAGSFGGAATVNGSTKNNDTYVYHGTGLSNQRFVTELYIDSDTTFTPATASRIGRAQRDDNTGDFSYNAEVMEVNTNNIKWQTGASNVIIISDAGVCNRVATGDYSYNISFYIFY